MYLEIHKLLYQESKYVHTDFQRDTVSLFSFVKREQMKGDCKKYKPKKTFFVVYKDSINKIRYVDYWFDGYPYFKIHYTYGQHYTYMQYFVFLNKSNNIKPPRSDAPQPYPSGHFIIDSIYGKIYYIDKYLGTVSELRQIIETDECLKALRRYRFSDNCLQTISEVRSYKGRMIEMVPHIKNATPYKNEKGECWNSQNLTIPDLRKITAKFSIRYDVLLSEKLIEYEWFGPNSKAKLLPFPKLNKNKLRRIFLIFKSNCRCRLGQK